MSMDRTEAAPWDPELGLTRVPIGQEPLGPRGQTCCLSPVLSSHRTRPLAARHLRLPPGLHVSGRPWAPSASIRLLTALSQGTSVRVTHSASCSDMRFLLPSRLFVLYFPISSLQHLFSFLLNFVKHQVIHVLGRTCPRADDRVAVVS